MNDFTIPKLLQHQQIVSDFVLSRAHAGVFLGVGGGKTCSILTSLYQARPAGHILVIAPKNIARSTWLDEIEKWNFPVRTKSFIVNERDKMLTRKQRLELYESVFNDPPTMYFINQELVKDLVDNMPVLRVQNGRTDSGRIRYVKQIQWPFTTIIIDESQGFKNPTSTRFKALEKIRGAVHRMILLTGTPTPNGLLDLWAQVYLLDGGQALGEKFTDYREKYFVPDKIIDGRAVSWELVSDQAEQEIYSRIQHLVMSAQNTTLPLPPITYARYNVTIDKDLLEAYKDFANQSVIDIVPEGSTKKEIVTIMGVNGGALRTKLLQFSSGTIYLDKVDDTGAPIQYDETQPRTSKGNDPYSVIHHDKIDMLDYLIRNNNQEPVMICYRFRSDQTEITRELTRRGYHLRTFDGSRAMIKDWNSGSIPIMLLQPASAGHGLNLQDGGSHIIWYTLPDSLEHWIQANGRLYRIGQKNPVTVSYLTTNKTLDAKQPLRLEAKAADQERLTGAVHLGATASADITNVEYGTSDLDLAMLVSEVDLDKIERSVAKK